MMRKLNLLIAMFAIVTVCKAQLSPAITSWLQNTTQTGTYYMAGNSIAQSNGILVNCQLVEYSANNVYIHTTGVPAYPTGPFLDGNPSVASNQNAIFKFPLAPVQNTGQPNPTTPGNIGVLINGVAMFDYRDGVAWNPNSSALCGGPGNPPCPGGMGVVMDWNRDAVPAEMDGFDCSKAHPAMGNYHHHQNPSAFKWDINILSTVCNLYDADGLYSINSAMHSPLIGFAYDGFPIYGAYGYKNANGTGGIERIRSGYQLRNITVRNIDPNGNTVSAGPNVSATYPLGYFKEDYEFIAHPNQEEYLDTHNGRFCITPEYPLGTYCYFATVDSNWNSAYPYFVGPTFYGVHANRKVTVVNELTTVYSPTIGIKDDDENKLMVRVSPNPSSEFIVIQVIGLNREALQVALYDASGKLISTSSINAGATNTFIDARTIYAGNYIVKVTGQRSSVSQQITIVK
ncbi:MAG: YHYH protein [Bacteroidetes bacterium]|nr:YHYH protein [Bacteroidota bacterium]